jgi:hypothetical protein
LSSLLVFFEKLGGIARNRLITETGAALEAGYRRLFSLSEPKLPEGRKSCKIKTAERFRSLGQGPKLQQGRPGVCAQRTLRKTKTAKRFWFAQGIEAVSFFAAGKKDTSG